MTNLPAPSTIFLYFQSRVADSSPMLGVLRIKQTKNKYALLAL